MCKNVFSLPAVTIDSSLTLRDLRWPSDPLHHTHTHDIIEHLCAPTTQCTKNSKASSSGGGVWIGTPICHWPVKSVSSSVIGWKRNPYLPYASMLCFWLCDWRSKCMCVHVSACVFCLLFCLFSSSISCLFALFSLSRCMLCTPLFSSLSLATDPVCLPPPNSLSRLFWQNLLFPDLLRALSLCITFFFFLWHKVAFLYHMISSVDLCGTVQKYLHIFLKIKSAGLCKTHLFMMIGCC